MKKALNNENSVKMKSYAGELHQKLQKAYLAKFPLKKGGKSQELANIFWNALKSEKKPKNEFYNAVQTKINQLHQEAALNRHKNRDIYVKVKLDFIIIVTNRG